MCDSTKIAEDGFKTINAERLRSVCEYVKKVEAEYWGRDNLCEREVEKLASTFQKIRQVKKTEIYCYDI